MRWYRPLYLSKNTADQIDKIREKAAAGAWVPGIYFVTLSSEPGHLLDLFHNTMLKESIFREVQRLDIVGVAQGRDPGTDPLAGKFRVVCTDHLQSQGRTQGWSDPGTSSCRLDVSAAFSALQASYRSGTYAAITGADLWDTRVETAGAKEREAEEG